MKSNSVIPLRNDRTKKANKMWVSLMATLGIGVAMYGIQKYQKEKLPSSVQNIMKKLNATGTPNVAGIARNNPIMEFSEEFLTGKMKRNAGNKS